MNPIHTQRAAFTRLTALGVALLALTAAGVALHIPGMGVVGTDARLAFFVGLLAVAVLVWFAAVDTAQHTEPRRALWLILGIAVACRIGPFLDMPFLSSDIYRYVWDGRVQAAGINPYLYVPADPILGPLRDAAIYPNINRADIAPTIYPPAAQMIFAAIGLSGLGIPAVKAAMLLSEALTLAAAGIVLRRVGRPLTNLVIWAWNPLIIWAFAGNGHIDAAAAAFLALTLALAPTGRWFAAGIAFAAAALTKFLPLAAAPAIWPQGGPRAAAVTLAMIVALYACYAGAGTGVFGYLPGYGGEEGLLDGSGFWLLSGLALIAPLPKVAGTIYITAAFILLGLLGAWIAFVRKPMTDLKIWRDAGIMMATVTVAISPHYPWYFAWLALPAMIIPSRALIWLSATPVILYIDPFTERFVWPALIYVPAVALAFLDRRRPLIAPRPFALAPPGEAA